MPDAEEFLRRLAPQVLAELQPPSGFKEFAHNSELVGQYVEASVRQLVRRYLAPIRVSTGGVIDSQQGPEAVRQLDTIAWIPAPVPAVFEVAEFALVPRSSSIAVLEIKSSAYDSVRLAEQTEPAFIKSVTTDALELADRSSPLGLGVVALLRDGQASRQLSDLRHEGRVVVLFEEVGGDAQPKPQGVYGLINFLARVRSRAKELDGLYRINTHSL